MKYLKSFENLNHPQIGDYILTKRVINQDELVDNINKFTSDNLGIVIGINYNPNNKETSYAVQYENIPRTLTNNFNYIDTPLNPNNKYKNYRTIIPYQILHYSNKPFDINLIKQGEKYNL